MFDGSVMMMFYVPGQNCDNITRRWICGELCVPNDLALWLNYNCFPELVNNSQMWIGCKVKYAKSRLNYAGTYATQGNWALVRNLCSYYATDTVHRLTGL